MVVDLTEPAVQEEKLFLRSKLGDENSCLVCSPVLNVNQWWRILFVAAKHIAQIRITNQTGSD